MLTAFKRYLWYLALGTCFIAVAAGAFLYDGTPAPLVAAGVVIALLVLTAAMEIMATTSHRKVLAALYIARRPVEAAEAYRVLLAQKYIRPNVRFSLQAYRSTALACAGSFQEALDLLEDMPVLPKRRQDAAKALLAGNRCAIYLSWDRPQEAEQQLELLRETLSSSPNKPELKPYRSSVELLELELRCVEGTSLPQDAEAMRAMQRQLGTPLRQAELGYWLGRIYVNLGDKSLAREFLPDAVKAGDQLWISARAKALLEGLDKEKK